jgi:hypothetical protein
MGIGQLNINITYCVPLSQFFYVSALEGKYLEYLI